MNGIQAVCILIIRLWALTIAYAALTWLVYLPNFDWSTSVKDSEFVGAGIGSAVQFCMGLAAWVFAPRLAKAATSGVAEGSVTIAFAEKEFVAIGSFLIGLFFIVRHMPAIIVRLVSLVIELAKDRPDSPFMMTSYDWMNLSAEAMLALFGAILAFRPQDIANMFSAARVAGLSNVELDVPQTKQNTPPETT
ncbi:MAG: hypothetical protein AAB227_03290 [Pseudomonadota bacterium]